MKRHSVADPKKRKSIDTVLAAARDRIDRLTPAEAYTAQLEGALLVDTRPQIYRDTEGAIPGALVIERNVLEWRLDPASEAAIAEASYSAEVIVVCNEGYASSLAAASLRDLGIRRATDLIGGYRAWRALGLPTESSDARYDALSDDARYDALSNDARYDAIVLT